jgi:hypothetical protein
LASWLKESIMIRSTNHAHSPVVRTGRRALASVTTALVMTSAHANLLNNPGFEISAFTSAANVLTNFPGFQGIWGPEVGSITGATAGVTPAAGSNMLRMDDDGLSYTQAFQVVDVSSFGATISTGTAMVNASAFFNTVGGFTGAFSLINVAFFSGPSYGTILGNSGNGLLMLDANPQTWEFGSVSSLIPIGTNWMMFQVAYNNASMAGNPGFVDDTSMTITPAPGSIALLLLAGIGGRRRRN